MAFSLSRVIRSFLIKCWFQKTTSGSANAAHPPTALVVTAEGASCAARAVPSRKACRPRGPRCFPADRFPDGVPASGESPAPRSYQNNQRAKHLRENTTTRPFEKASRRVRTPSVSPSPRLPLAFFPKGDTRATWTHRGQLAGRLGHAGATRGADSAPGAATRSVEWTHGLLSPSGVCG